MGGRFLYVNPLYIFIPRRTCWTCSGILHFLLRRSFHPLHYIHSSPSPFLRHSITSVTTPFLPSTATIAISHKHSSRSPRSPNSLNNVAPSYSRTPPSPRRHNIFSPHHLSSSFFLAPNYRTRNSLYCLCLSLRRKG